MAVRQDINVGLLAFVGLVGSMLLLIIFWGVEGWFAYEVDVLTASRYEIDRNQQWLDRRDEQYANIGDIVGNASVYSVAEVGELPAGGYRFPTRERNVAVIPIHAAMAHLVSELTGEQVTAEQMRALDTQPTRISNDAYLEYMTPAEVLRATQEQIGGGPTTRPADEPEGSGGEPEASGAAS